MYTTENLTKPGAEQKSSGGINSGSSLLTNRAQIKR